MIIYPKLIHSSFFHNRLWYYTYTPIFLDRKKAENITFGFKSLLPKLGVRITEFAHYKHNKHRQHSEPFILLEAMLPIIWSLFECILGIFEFQSSKHYDWKDFCLLASSTSYNHCSFNSIFFMVWMMVIYWFLKSYVFNASSNHWFKDACFT